jgi:putative transcriptional regulator
MIKHHPSFEILNAFVEGELPASLSAAVAIHADMCPKCQNQIAQLTEQVAENSFEENFLHQFIVDESDDIAGLSEVDFDAMLHSITDDASIDEVKVTSERTVQMRDKHYTLPKQLSNMTITAPASIGHLARSRVQLDEGEIHTSLLHIEPGGSVPEHTHKGFELTLLLDGSFHDKYGEYVAGDFIMLDGEHVHHPVTEHGCLCFTVANDSLKFTQGLNKLLNPIGRLIY